MAVLTTCTRLLFCTAHTSLIFMDGWNYLTEKKLHSASSKNSDQISYDTALHTVYTWKYFRNKKLSLDLSSLADSDTPSVFFTVCLIYSHYYDLSKKTRILEIDFPFLYSTLTWNYRGLKRFEHFLSFVITCSRSLSKKGLQIYFLQLCWYIMVGRWSSNFLESWKVD